MIGLIRLSFVHFENGGRRMRLASKSLMLKFGIVALVAIAGTTAIYAWQAPTHKVENKPTLATGNMSAIIWALHHNNAHMDNLPVQALEGRD
jgi:uncharacterized membrane protein